MRGNVVSWDYMLTSASRSHDAYEERCHLLTEWEGVSACGAIALVYAFTYFVFLFLLLLPILDQHPVFARVVMIAFHASLIMVMCCWAQTMMIHPGSPEHEVCFGSKKFSEESYHFMSLTI